MNLSTTLKRSLGAMIVASAVILSAPAASAQRTFGYTDGDVFLCFRATGGQGGSTDYMVNLGPVTQFTSAAGHLDVNLDGTLNPTQSIATDLVATYGANWKTRPDILWGVVGVKKFSGLGFAANTMFASRHETKAGYASPAWLRASINGSQVPAGKIQAMGSRYQLGTTTTGGNQTISSNNPLGLFQATSITNSYFQYQPGGLSTTGATAFSYFDDPSGIESSFASGTLNSVLDFYTLAPGSGNAAFVGGFRMTDAGNLVFETSVAVFDTVTETPALNTPADNAVVHSPIAVSYTLTEPAKAGSVVLSFGGNSYTLAAADETEGTHTFTFDPASPVNADIVSGSVLPAGTYTVTLTYQDIHNNTVAQDTNTNVEVVTAPLATTNPATPVTEFTATLNASITPNSSTGSVSFLYGLSDPPMTETTPQATAPGTNNVFASISGLAANTPYFFRVKVTNAAGTTLGTVLSFTTASDQATGEALYSKNGAVPFAGVPNSGIPASAIWTGFGPPAVNDHGQIAFTGKWKAPAPNKPGAGIFVDGALLVKTGDAVPNSVGHTFKGFKDPVIDNRGHVAFLATIAGTGIVSTNDTVVVTNGRDGNLEVLAQEGSIAPGAGNATFKAFTAVSIKGEPPVEVAQVEAPVVATSQSGIVFFASLNKATGTPTVISTNDTGVWWLPAGQTAVALMVREGDPGFVGAETIKSFVLLKGLAGSPAQGRGQVSGNEAQLQVGLSSNDQALVDATPGSLVPFARTGGLLNSTALPGVKWAKMDLNSASDGGFDSSVLGTLTAKVGGVVSANAKGIFATDDDAATWEPVARTADADAPGMGTGAKFASFRDPVNASTGPGVAFLGAAKGGTVTSLNDVGIWWKPHGGSLQLVAREGATPPSAPSGAKWKVFSSVALPGGGSGPIFTAAMDKGTGGAAGPGNITSVDDVGLYAVDAAGTTHELVRENQPIAGITGKTVKMFNVLKAVSGSAGATRSFNANGAVVVLVTFTDNTTSIVKVSLPLGF